MLGGVGGTVDVAGSRGSRAQSPAAPTEDAGGAPGTVDTPAAQTAVQSAAERLNGQNNTAPQAGAVSNENGLNAFSEQEQVNLSSGKKNKIVSTFSDAVSFVKNALADKSNVDRAYLGKVPESVAQKVLMDTGIDISGYSAVIPSGSVRHMFKQHGDPIREASIGQISLTPEIAAKIPEIIAAPDKVTLSERADVSGGPALLFEKSIGDQHITVQAVSDGTHSIQTDTLYVRKKTPQDTVSNTGAEAQALNSNVRNVPPQGSFSDFTIPQGEDAVNTDTAAETPFSAADTAEAAAQAAPGPVQAGRVTTIRRPYQGKTPVQTQKSAAVVTVDSGSVERAQNRIDGAQNLANTPAGKSFKSVLRNAYKSVFQAAKSVPVKGLTFEGQPYTVDIPNSVPGKVISDPNLTAEKLALLDILPQVVQNGEYVGSGEYVQHSRKEKAVLRYDYFETPVAINGQNYIAKFDVEVLPMANNYRTHQLINMDLITSEAKLTGRDPALSSNVSGPVEGTRPLNVDSTIAQASDSVNAGTAAGSLLGTARQEESGLHFGMPGDMLEKTGGQEEAHGPQAPENAGGVQRSSGKRTGLSGWAGGRVIEGGPDDGQNEYDSQGVFGEDVRRGIERSDPGRDGKNQAGNGTDRTRNGNPQGPSEWARKNLIDRPAPAAGEAAENAARYCADVFVVKDSAIKGRNPRAWALTSGGKIYISDDLPSDLASIVGFHESVHAAKQNKNQRYIDFVDDVGSYINFQSDGMNTLGIVVQARFPGKDLMELSPSERETVYDELNALVWGFHKADPENARAQFAEMFRDYDAYIRALDAAMESVHQRADGPGASGTAEGRL